MIRKHVVRVRLPVPQNADGLAPNVELPILVSGLGCRDDSGGVHYLHGRSLESMITDSL